MNVLCFSYLLSSPLVFLRKRGFTGSYEDALGKKFYGKNRCLETYTTQGQESVKSTRNGRILNNHGGVVVFLGEV